MVLTIFVSHHGAQAWGFARHRNLLVIKVMAASFNIDGKERLKLGITLMDVLPCYLIVLRNVIFYSSTMIKYVCKTKIMYHICFTLYWWYKYLSYMNSSKFTVIICFIPSVPLIVGILIILSSTKTRSMAIKWWTITQYF